MDFMCIKVQREYSSIASTGLHFSTEYDRYTDLTDCNFLDFARKHLESNEWNDRLCSWFEAAVLLIEKHGEQCIIHGGTSKRPLHLTQLNMGMKNVYRTLT